jgi:hypothetical protein
VVTERTVFAMPRPGSVCFGRRRDLCAAAPARRARHGLGLTGARLRRPDCVWARLGSCHVPAALALEDALARADLAVMRMARSTRCWRAFRCRRAGAARRGHRTDRTRYGRHDLGVPGAGNETSGWGAAQLEQLSTKSPTNLA